MAVLRFMKNQQAQAMNRIQFGALDFVGEGAPLSGTSGHGINVCGKGSTYTNITTGVKYVNEGTAANPYWTPMTYNSPNLLAWWSDFRDSLGVAVADTNASVTLAGSGLRVFGTAQPVADGGLTVAQGQGGAVASMFCGATTEKLIALGVGGTTVPFSPVNAGPLVIDATVAQLTALTLRRWFFGFVGTAIDAFISPATGATVTITNVEDNLAGLMFDVGLTQATKVMATHNKADDTPTLLVSATGVDTGVSVVANAYNRFRVEIDNAGNATFFIDKIQVSRFALAVTPGTHLAPVLALHSTSAAAKTQLVKQFATWANRV